MIENIFLCLVNAEREDSFNSSNSGREEEDISSSIALQFMQPMRMDEAMQTIPDAIAAQFNDTMDILVDTAPVNVGAGSSDVDDTRCK